MKSSCSCNPSFIGVNLAGTTQVREKPEVMCDSFTPLIQSFFGRMTADQWQLLKAGTPDETTKSLLAELLMNIVTFLSNGFLAALQNLNVTMSTEQVQASLGDTLSESFAEVLGIQDNMDVNLEASEHLKDLVVKEVSETVNSFLKEPSLNQQATNPRRLTAMLRHTLTMLKRLMRNVCIPRVKQRRRRISPPESVKEKLVEEVLKTDGDEEDEEGEDEPTRAEEVVRFTEVEEEDKTMEDEEPSAEDNLLNVTTKAALDIIRKEVDTITEPLLEEVGDTEYELLQMHVSVEIENLADDVTQLMVEESKSVDQLFEAVAKPKAKAEPFLRVVAQKVKAVLAKCRAKAWMLCMVAPYKRKSRQTIVVDKESLQPLLEIIDSLFVSVDEDSQKVCVFPKLKDVSQGRDPQFTKELSETIDNYISGRYMRKKKPGKTTVAPDIDAHTTNIIKIFLSVMNWWLQTQADQHVDKVTLELVGFEFYEENQMAEVPTEETVPLAASVLTPSERATPAKQGERQRIAVRILVEHVVSRIIKKAKVSWAADDQVIMERLFDKVWPEVEGANFPVTAQTFINFDKILYRNLCKRWGNARMALLSVSLQEASIEDYITSCIKAHLLFQPKRNIFSRLISWLGSAFRLFIILIFI